MRRTGGTLRYLMAAIVIVGFAALATPPMVPDETCCDHLFYREMAYRLTGGEPPAWGLPPRLAEVYAHPYHGQYFAVENGLAAQPPYRYRVLAPILARGLGLPLGDDVQRGFAVLTVLALIAALTLFPLAVWYASGSWLVGAFVQFGLALSPWIVRFHLYDFELVDPLAYACLAGATFMLVNGRRGRFFLLCALGGLAKEIVLVTAPAYLLWEWLTMRRVALRTIIGTGLAPLPYLALRALLPVPVAVYNLRTVWAGPQSAEEMATWIVAAWGLALVLLAVAGIGRSRLALALSPLLGGSLAAACFATDRERALVYGLFALLPAAATGLRTAAQGRPSRRRAEVA